MVTTLVIYEADDRLLITTRDREEELINHFFDVGGTPSICGYKRWGTQVCGVFVRRLDSEKALSVVSCRACIPSQVPKRLPHAPSETP